MVSSVQKNVFFGGLALVGIAFFLFILLPNSEPELAIDKETVTNIDETNTTTLNAQTATKNTIATAWQWNTNPLAEGAEKDKNYTENSTKLPSNASNLPFTQESVYQALHAVNLDSNGDLILDNQALISLNTALDYDEVTLDEEALAELQTLIKKGLPGNAGEQTAQIVADFYHYLGAKKEFNTLYETYTDDDQAIEHYEMQYDELNALRELYLGSEVADQLFATANANSRYMFESMKIESNDTLSDAEKTRQQAEIIKAHEEKTINISNWSDRYQAFLDEKNYITQSSLSNSQKRQQLTDLMHQHFTYEELEYVRHLQLEAL